MFLTDSHYCPESHKVALVFTSFANTRAKQGALFQSMYCGKQSTSADQDPVVHLYADY